MRDTDVLRTGVSFLSSPFPLSLRIDAEMTRHAKNRSSPVFKQTQDSEETQRKDGEERMLGCYFRTVVQLRSHSESNCFLWPFLVSQSLSPTLAGRIVALVVVPGVLVAVAAVLWLLEKNRNKQIRFTEHLIPP